MSATLPPDQPERESLLSLLNSEIEELQSEHTRSGWSVWAILVGIAGVLWLFTDEIKAGAFNFSNVARAFVAGMTLLDLSYLTYVRLTNGSPSKETESRFTLAGEFLAGKVFLIVVDVTRIVLLLLLAYYIPLGWNIFTPLLIGYLTYLAVNLFALALKYYWPRLALDPNPSTRAAKVGINLWWLCASVPMLLSLILLIPTLPALAGTNITYYRMAGLLLVAAVLTGRLLSVLAPSSRLKSLRDVRRQFVLGKIDISEAATRTDIALGGIRTIDALRDVFLSLMTLTDKMDEQADGAKLALNSMERIINTTTIISAEQRETLTALEGGYQRCMDERLKYFELYKVHIKEFNETVTWILRGKPSEQQTVASIGQLLNNRGESSDKKYFSLLDKYNQLKNRIDMLPPKPTGET